MSPLRTYLWKEWRDQRAGVLGLLLLLPCLPVVAVLLGQGKLLDFGLLSGIGACAGCVAAMLVIGTHLIPGEIAGSGMRFLERMPGGLHRAFVAKFAFYLLVVGGFAFYGNAIVQVTQLMRGPVVDPVRYFDQYVLYGAILPAFCCALWIFAVSSWVPNGALALPTGMICMAAFCWPGHIMFLPSEWSSTWYVMMSWEPIALFVVSSGAAGLSAWASFAFGLRRGANRTKATIVGLGVAVIAVSPIWAWTAYRWHRVVHLDPTYEEFVIRGVSVDDSNEWMTVSIIREENLSLVGLPAIESVLHKFALNLRTGHWLPSDEELGGLGGELANTGSSGQGELPPEELELPDGLHLDLSDLGLGNLVLDQQSERVGFYDWSRSGFFGMDELPSEFQKIYASHLRPALVILPDFWLIRKRGLFEDVGPGEGWACFEPTNGCWSEAQYMKEGDRIVAVLEDGRLFLHRQDDLLLLNAVNGEQENVTIIGNDPGPQWLFSFGRTVLPLDSISLLGFRAHQAAFDPELTLLRWFEDKTVYYIKQTGPCSVLIFDENHRVQRLNLETGARKTLFP